MNYEAVGRYIIERAKEPTTWRGLVLILTAIGVQVSPEKQELIVTIGLGFAGLIGAAIPEKK